MVQNQTDWSCSINIALFSEMRFDLLDAQSLHDACERLDASLTGLSLTSRVF